MAKMEFQDTVDQIFTQFLAPYPSYIYPRSTQHVQASRRLEVKMDVNQQKVIGGDSLNTTSFSCAT